MPKLMIMCVILDENMLITNPVVPINAPTTQTKSVGFNINILQPFAKIIAVVGCSRKHYVIKQAHKMLRSPRNFTASTAYAANTNFQKFG